MPVMKNPPRPGTTEWRGMITASKVPTLLGLSPWSSPYALWHQMYAGLEPPALEGDHLRWGHISEQSLVGWWLDANPDWTVNPPVRGVTEITYHDPSLPFPNAVTLDRRAWHRGKRAHHIIECKTTRDMDQWGRPGDPDSIPAHYLAQVIFQMGVSGIHEASVVVLGFGTPEIHTVEWDEDVWDSIVAACTRWHHTGQAGDPPPLDDRTATYDAVRGLHPDIDRDTDTQINHGEAVALLDALEEEAAAKATVIAAKTRLLDQMGTARRALVGDTTIATRTQGRGDSITLRINRKANLT